MSAVIGHCDYFGFHLFYNTQLYAVLNVIKLLFFTFSHLIRECVLGQFKTFAKK